MKLAAAACLLCVAAAPAPSGHLAYIGVNLSGAEFGVPDGFTHRYDPGTLGHTYTFPPQAEVDAYAAAGFNAIRLPFAWERLQPVANGAFDGAYLAGLDGVVRAAAERGMAVILEPANFGYGYGALIGSAGTPASTFADLWRRLAAHYRRRPGVMFGLMNEPHDHTPAEWLVAAQAAIAAIRAAGARQEILVPGTFYAQGASWVSRGNAAQFADHVTDPAQNLAFEIHQYNDADQSGRDPEPVSATIGAERLAEVTTWAEMKHRRLFLAEFGAGSSAASLAAMRNQLTFVQAHRRAWQGAAIWGGGPWWPADYPLAVDPKGGVASPQVEALREYMPGAAAGRLLHHDPRARVHGGAQLLP